MVRHGLRRSKDFSTSVEVALLIAARDKLDWILYQVEEAKQKKDEADTATMNRIPQFGAKVIASNRNQCLLARATRPPSSPCGAYQILQTCAAGRTIG
jgi:hypothetical protein